MSQSKNTETIVFDVKASEKLLDIFGESGLKEISYLAESMSELSAASRRERIEEVARLTDFIIACTFLGSSRWQQFQKIASLNPSCYELFVHPRAQVVLDLYGTEVNLSSIYGLSACLPITPLGMHEFLTNQCMARDLIHRGHVVTERQSDRLLIAGAIALPSLPELFRIRKFDKHRNVPLESKAKAFMRRCFLPHFYSMLPPLDINASHDSLEIVRCDGGELPIVACPISGRGMGQPLVHNAQFVVDESTPKDLNGNLKYVLDFADANRSEVAANRREHIIEIVSRQRQFTDG